MAILNEEIKSQVKELLSGLDDQVTITLVKKASPYLADIEGLVDEIAPLSEKVVLEKVEFNDEAKQKFGIEDGPALVISSENVKGRITYFGLPSGYEFGAFIEAIRLAGSKNVDMDSKLKQFVEDVEAKDKDVLLEVFVTPSCPHCPTSAYVAYKLARVCSKVTAHVYEATEFPELSNHYRVSGVPHTVINKGEGEYIGGYPEPHAIDQIRNALGL
ncbi:MAG: hypothetical protein PWP03_112 [Candidatus Woesearchaeota archaeon]|nr:hypothetical protein [Candidatus Woesearchaeota archaeon]MDN5327474.1 hypothetical protein [Candidatus Woesearchaeota archaeon]